MFNGPRFRFGDWSGLLHQRRGSLQPHVGARWGSKYEDSVERGANNDNNMISRVSLRSAESVIVRLFPCSPLVDIMIIHNDNLFGGFLGTSSSSELEADCSQLFKRKFQVLLKSIISRSIFCQTHLGLERVDFDAERRLKHPAKLSIATPEPLARLRSRALSIRHHVKKLGKPAKEFSVQKFDFS